MNTCPRCNGEAIRVFCGECDARIGQERETARTQASNLHTWGHITEEQRDRLIGIIDGTTVPLAADRAPLVMGQRYVDYDLRDCVLVGICDVSLDARERNGAAIWWRTTTGMFDGTRLAARRPY